MSARLQRFLNVLKHHWQFLVFAVFSTALLISLNCMLWPTPDEYLYATITRSYIAAAHGEVAWSDINTEHIGLVPWFGYVAQQVFHLDQFTSLRYLTVIFALGFIVLLYQLPKHLGFAQHERMWLLWALPLVTGFWMFAVRYMLDVPAAFTIGILVWLLAKRAPAWQAGLALASVLLVKEYYWFLMLPVVSIPLLLDQCMAPERLRVRLSRLCVGAISLALPSLVVIVILLDFNVFPYPRLLNTSLAAIFGDFYIASNQFILTLLGRSLEFTELLVNNSQHSISGATDGMSTISKTLADPANGMHTTGQTLQGLVDAQHPYASSNFWQKLWLIYATNFSENDVNIFLLPSALVGVAITLRQIWSKFKSAYLTVRTDIIFMLLFLVFLYFNYHQADFAHGFRITLPITLCLVYFAARAVQTMVNKPTKANLSSWALLVALSLVGYGLAAQASSGGSALTTASFLQTIVHYKVLIYIVIFVAVAIVFIWSVRRTHWRWRQPVLLGLIAGLTLMKFLPVYGEYAIRSSDHHYDYGASDATSVLEPLRAADTEKDIVKYWGNMHPYRVQYYANDPIITNDLITPGARKFTTIYPKRYYGGVVNNDLPLLLEVEKIDYLFLNYTYSGAATTDLENMQALVAAQPERFTLIAEQQYNSQIEWQIYQYHYDNEPSL